MVLDLKSGHFNPKSSYFDLKVAVFTLKSGHFGHTILNNILIAKKSCLAQKKMSKGDPMV